MCCAAFEYLLATDKKEKQVTSSHLIQESYLSLQFTDDFLALPFPPQLSWSNNRCKELCKAFPLTDFPEFKTAILPFPYLVSSNQAKTAIV